MRERKIALLVDVDNVKISGNAFLELYDKLNDLGEVVYCKFYGYNDRKHIYLNEYILKYGYETAPFMRFKKRFSQIDNRIVVDAVKLNYIKPEINTFCIIAGDGDLIPLLVELKSSGKYLIDANTDYQEINTHMYDEHIDLKSISEVAEVYVSKQTKTDVVKTKVKPEKVVKVEQPKKEVEVKIEDKDTVVKTEQGFNLASVIRDITSRYNELDFSNNSEMPQKLKLINDIESLIYKENMKGEGLYSADQEIKEIFNELQDIVDEMKNAL